MKNDWGAELLQSDRSWICVYIVKYVTETLQFCRINQARLQQQQHTINNPESAWMKYKTCRARLFSSVNSVTSIALHGAPHRCVSATEAGSHNRNLIQPFYGQGETHCIPSNNRHCLNIHVLLCNKSYNLLHTCVHVRTFSRIVMEGCNALYCVCVHI